MQINNFFEFVFEILNLDTKKSGQIQACFLSKYAIEIDSQLESPN